MVLVLVLGWPNSWGLVTASNRRRQDRSASIIQSLVVQQLAKRMEQRQPGVTCCDSCVAYRCRCRCCCSAPLAFGC